MRASLLARPRAVVGAVLVVAAALLAGPAVATPPPAPAYGAAIDAYAGYDGQDECLTTAAPGMVSFRDTVLRAYPGIGSPGSILRSCSTGGTSEHKEGRAWDWMVDARVPEQRAAAYELLDWLLAPDAHGNPHALLRRFGIMYMIYDGKIFKAYQASKGWQTYTGASPHVDHVHFSMSWAGARKQTTWWTAALWSWAPGSPAAWYDGELLRLASRSATGSAVVAGWTPQDGVRDSEDLGGSVVGGLGITTRADGTVVVVARGQNDALYVKERPPGGSWSAWTSLGATLSARPAVAQSPDGGVEVVARGRDGKVYVRSSAAPGSWTWWQVVPGLLTNPAGPAVTAGGPGTGSLFAVGTDAAVWRSVRTESGWSGWTRAGGSTASDLAAADAGQAGVLLTARGMNGRNYTRAFRPTGSTGWTVLAGTPASSAALAGQPEGSRAEVVAWGGDGRLYRATEVAGSWSAWSRFS